ncbi:MAG: CotH kinase family protein, partial [Lachnospiraceae bacterium]|nr:CotH kinase family protein [Lachnospiraceae bacterium]
MNRKWRKSLMAILLVIACVVTLVPQGQIVFSEQKAAAAVAKPSIVANDTTGSLWVDGSSYSDDNNKDLIQWKSKDSKYYLYLPSSVDLNNLVIWHSFSSDPYVNGKKIVNGETTNIFANAGNFTMTVGSKSYNLVVMKSKNINTMFLTTSKGNLDAVNHSEKHTVSDSGDIVCVDKNGNVESGVLDSIKGRGNSSWKSCYQGLFSKRPYGIKVYQLNAKGKKKGIPVFGMQAAKKWCLLANNFDQALIRNKYVYDLCEDAGMAFTPESELADVYENGRYIGNYLVTNKVEVNDTSVDITDLEEKTTEATGKEAEEFASNRGVSKGGLYDVTAGAYKYVNGPTNPENITGGYLLEFELDDKGERYDQEISGFVSNRRQPVVIKSPEYATKEQAKYIYTYFQEMEDAVYSSNGVNSLGKSYKDYIDLQSAAEMYVIEEFTKDNDAVATSFYCYKDENGKLCFGPAWDFDWAFGGYNSEKLKSTTGDYVRNKHIYKQGGGSTTINLLGTLYNNHEEFQDMVCKVWKEKFAPLIKVSLGETSPFTPNAKAIDTYKSINESSAAMNYKRYSMLNHTIWNSTPTGSTYSDAVKYFKNFVAGRYKYMNSVYGGTVSSTTLYFDNSNVNWSNVYAYVWNNADGSDAKEITGTKVHNNVYSFTIRNYANIIFKNTSGTWDKQTQDISIGSLTNNCFKPNNSYTDNKINSGTWYDYNIPTPTVSVAPTASVPPVNGNVYFDNSNVNWSNVYAYVWNNADGSDATELTGTKVSNTVYRFNPKGYSNIIFKNTYGTWDKQTEDIALASIPANCFKANNSYTNNKINSNTWYIYIENTVAPTPTGIPTLAPTATVKPTVTPTVTPTSTPNKDLIYFDNTYVKWSNVYAYVWNYADGSDAKEITGTKVDENVYRFSTTGYAYIIFKNTLGRWDKQTEDIEVATIPFNCFKGYDGYTDNKINSCSWYEYIEGTTAPTVIPTQVPDNTVTIYYNKSGWSKAYMHYNATGAWTTAPGTAMSTSDRSDYKWKITVTLSNVASLKACFNNGSGVWDNNNTNNYILTPGVYGISNGTVTKLENVVTAVPTVVPTQAPTAVPKVVPTQAPTAVPTVVPTQAPTAVPTVVPTQAPTAVPTVVPTQAPTAVP